MDNCLIITNLQYPENRGITQLVEKLNRRGLHPVIISRPPQAKDRQVKNNVTLTPFYSKNSRLMRVLFAQSLWWNPLLLFAIFAAVKKYRPICIFVREPSFLLAPLFVARFLKIDLYLDLRENPVSFISNKGLKYSRRILSGPACVKRLFIKKAFKFVCHFFCVSRELCDLISKEYGVAQDIISVLPNYPSSQFIKKSNEMIRTTLKINQNLKLIHAGYVSEDRGLQRILPAIARMKELGYRCSLTIIGNGNYMEQLKRQCYEMKIKDSVIFLPAIEPLDLPALLAQHDVGVCANEINENSMVTIPGKLFEYMANGLAILSNSRPTVVNIINEAECGVSYASCEPDKITETLLSLALKHTHLRELGRNAMAYLKEKIEDERYDLPIWLGKPNQKHMKN